MILNNKSIEQVCSTSIKKRHEDLKTIISEKEFEESEIIED
jgi:hypothetical protein